MKRGNYIRTKEHRIQMSNALRNGKSIECRFLERIKFSIKCWSWNGCRISGGYGMLGIYGSLKLAHRFSYEIFNGRIYGTNEIHHLCENPICVNPGHLEQLTNRKHILIGNGVGAINKRKTLCKRGHKLPTIKNNKRRCNKCRKIRKD